MRDGAGGVAGSGAEVIYGKASWVTARLGRPFSDRSQSPHLMSADPPPSARWNLLVPAAGAGDFRNETNARLVPRSKKGQRACAAGSPSGCQNRPRRPPPGQPSPHAAGSSVDSTQPSAPLRAGAGGRSGDDAPSKNGKDFESARDKGLQHNGGRLAVGVATPVQFDCRLTSAPLSTIARGTLTPTAPWAHHAAEKAAGQGHLLLRRGTASTRWRTDTRRIVLAVRRLAPAAPLVGLDRPDSPPV